MAADRPPTAVAAASNATVGPPGPAGPPPGAGAAWLLVTAGACAAMHVGKLAPAIPALQQALGMTLVQAGFLLSVVQVAGMLLGLALGAVADALGERRSIVLGLSLLACASALGGFAHDVAALMVLRLLEGLGFLWVVLPTPGLMRKTIAPAHLNRALGVWGAYMPSATATALVLGPLVIASAGWPAWWWLLSALTAGMALVLVTLWWPLKPPVQVPDPAASSVRAAPATRMQAGAVSVFIQRIVLTLGSVGPWAVALCFALYSAQWLAVIGFLPSIVQEAGWVGNSSLRLGLLTAAVAAANILGNVGGGRLLHRGVKPTRLLCAGFLMMAAAAFCAFVTWPLMGGAPAASTPAPLFPPSLRYVALLLFSGCGGLIPATLFAMVVRLAPGPQTLGTTMGWVQQGSSFGQFAGPPLVAWIASAAGGWHLSWLATGGCALVGVMVSLWLGRLSARAG